MNCSWAAGRIGLPNRSSPSQGSTQRLPQERTCWMWAAVQGGSPLPRRRERHNLLRTHARLRATCGVLWRAWSDGVVPLRVELVALDIEARHLLVANLDLLRIAPRVQHAVHCQPARRRGRGNQIHDGRMADERTASPILGDVAEQAMLDRVPLRGSGWIVADRDR